MRKILRILLDFQKHDDKKLSWRELHKTILISLKKENRNALIFKKLLDKEEWDVACEFVKYNPISLSWHSAAYPKCVMNYFLNSMSEPVFASYQPVFLQIFSHLLNQNYPIYDSFTKYKNLVSIEGVGGNYEENISKNIKKGSLYSGVDLLWMVLRKSTLDCEIKKQFTFYLLDNGFNPKRVFMPHIKKVIGFIVLYEPQKTDFLGLRNAKIYGEIFERLLSAGFDPNCSIEEEFGSRTLLSKNIAALDIAALTFSKSTIDTLLQHGAKLKNDWSNSEHMSSLAYIKEQQKILAEKSSLSNWIPLKDMTHKNSSEGRDNGSGDASEGSFSFKL